MNQYQQTLGFELPIHEKPHYSLITTDDSTEVPRVVDEFWTSRQRRGSSLHEVSYRACFKPQIPSYFINTYTEAGQVVYDPFAGRGTTVLESALLGRSAIQTDVNPLARIMVEGRLAFPALPTIKERLEAIKLWPQSEVDIDLSMFYHEATLLEIGRLRSYLRDKHVSGTEDGVDKWIKTVATNRLTGHSRGFFSVYTFPPNQAISAERQLKINAQRKQAPEFRDIYALTLKKSQQLQSNVTQEQMLNLQRYGRNAELLTQPAHSTPEIENESVDLIVTSPPFLDIVQYKQDNWLRLWFNCIEPGDFKHEISVFKRIDDWTNYMQSAFSEFARVLRLNGTLAFEVGELRKGRVKLDEYVEELGTPFGLKCQLVLINQQAFTKTSHIWGVKNNQKGTNTNRVVVFRKT